MNLRSEKMIANKPKYKGRVLQDKFDQYTTQSFSFEIKIIDIEIPRVRILAGNDFILKRSVESELTSLEVVMGQPRKNSDEQAKYKEGSKKIRRSVFPAQ